MTFPAAAIFAFRLLASERRGTGLHWVVSALEGLIQNVRAGWLSDQRIFARAAAEAAHPLLCRFGSAGDEARKIQPQ